MDIKDNGNIILLIIQKQNYQKKNIKIKSEKAEYNKKKKIIIFLQ